MRQVGELNPELLKSTVASMARSIERNPDAMMLLSKIGAAAQLPQGLDDMVLQHHDATGPQRISAGVALSRCPTVANRRQGG